MDATLDTTATRELVGERLTAWSVSGDGSRVRLGFADGAGHPCRIDLPTEVGSGLLLTLPCVLQRALDAGGDRNARIVHPLDTWRLEQAVERGLLILTLSTPDGFGVAFAVTPGDLSAMGEAGTSSPRPASWSVN